ncbi:MAG: hypothetical protein N2690_04120 [Rhodocyclaceae bacterium]|nr:hypothetical protein [Rhodocyclaceae bacterium]
MKPEIDESTVRLVGGMIDAMQCLIALLEAQGAIRRDDLAQAITIRLDKMPEDALEAAPLAVLLRWLRPSDPPRPQLRLIHGGKDG